MQQSQGHRVQQGPYMYKMYNISGYFVGYGTRGPLNIINSVIDALNDNDHLPKIILIVPDQDLLQGTMKSAFVLGSSLHYTVKQLDLAIERRYQDLLHKRIGSLTENYPRTIWVRMLKRPNPDELKNLDSAFGLRGKFNSILEEQLLDGRADEHHIMSIVVQSDHLNNAGNLTEAGKAVFWNEVYKAVRKFDLGEITLKLRNSANNNAAPAKFVNNMAKDFKAHHKLPTPPPSKSTRERSNSKSRKSQHSGRQTSHRCQRHSSHDRSHRHGSHSYDYGGYHSRYHGGHDQDYFEHKHCGHHH